MKANQGMPANDNGIMALALDPSNPSNLFAGTGFLRVYRSTDDAGSWERVVDGEFGRVDALAVAPSNSSIVYGGGVSTAFKSTDGGDTWNSISSGLDNAGRFRQIAVHPTNPDIVYVAADGGLFKTTDGGAGWALLTTLNDGISSVVLDPTSPGTVYAGGVKKVLKSTNSGASFVEQDGVFGELVVNSLAIDPGNPQTLYAGMSFFEGLFKTTDGGANWNRSNSGLRNIDILSIAFDAQSPMTIYTSADVGGVHKSTDGGQTWEAKRDGVLPGFVDINDIVVDPVNPLNVYVGIDFLGAFTGATMGRRAGTQPTPLGGPLCMSWGSIQPILRPFMPLTRLAFTRAPTGPGIGSRLATVSRLPWNSGLWPRIRLMETPCTSDRVPGSVRRRRRESTRPPTGEMSGRQPTRVLRSPSRSWLWRSTPEILPRFMRAVSVGYSRKVRTGPPAG